MEKTEVVTSASGLHMVLGMKRFAVAILAMAALSGCGVGADEYWDGEKLVSRSSQALEQNPDTAPELPSAGGAQAPGPTAPSGTRDPSTVALPQDPIPVFEGKPVPGAPPPMIDPSYDPLPGFDPRRGTPGLR
jgi:hypothetical protein